MDYEEYLRHKKYCIAYEELKHVENIDDYLCGFLLSKLKIPRYISKMLHILLDQHHCIKVSEIDGEWILKYSGFGEKAADTIDSLKSDLNKYGLNRLIEIQTNYSLGRKPSSYRKALRRYQYIEEKER